MTRFALALALAACSQTPSKPAAKQKAAIARFSCGVGCSSSAACGGGLDSCRYCDKGVCTNILPAQPVLDAGIDAPGGTQP